jgi:hypothetical protein
MVIIGWWLTAKLHGNGRQKKTASRKWSGCAVLEADGGN